LLAQGCTIVVENPAEGDSDSAIPAGLRNVGPRFLIIYSFYAPAYILGIESSCDETAAAVVRSGEQVISNVVASQIAMHQPYGGVVPELASREHLRAIVPVVRQALARSEAYLFFGRRHRSHPGARPRWRADGGHQLRQGSGLRAREAADRGESSRRPHSCGSIGRAAKGQPRVAVSLCWLWSYPADTRTCIWRNKKMRGWTYENVGHTRDDAAGEAFDKVAKLLGLGYPGGPIIDRLAPHGDPRAVKFPPAQIKHRDRRTRGADDDRNHNRGKSEAAIERERFDFSFSGIKTAVLRYVEVHEMHPIIENLRQAMSNILRPKLEDYLAYSDRKTLDLVASFQRAIVDDLVGKTLAAASAHHVATLFVTGGVAANSELRSTFGLASAKQGLPVYFPSRPLSTDNAAMIAAAAYPKFLARDFAPMDFSAEAGLVLR
jgi:N6-L-threonylcarbamoyladenine synthase